MLTAEQQAARKNKLTASRVACLMTGDAVKIMQLYNEMIGEGEPENLDHVWPVRLGEATEALQLDWFEQKNGFPVIGRGQVIVNSNGWAACTLDGWVENPGYQYPIEAKHCGGREPIEVIIDRYQPQLQWTMFVTGSRQAAITIIMGANEPIVEFIDRDDKYIAEMVKRGKQFMDCVAARRPPVALDPAPPPADASRVYDMCENNVWASYAIEWIETKPAADQCKNAEKVLKAAVPDDAKKCHGHGIQITRDRAGRLSLREMTS